MDDRHARNQQVRKILESREIAEQQRREIREKQKNRKNGHWTGMDSDNLYCRNSLFPWK